MKVVEVATKDTNGISINPIHIGATMISTLDLQREEEEDKKEDTTILLTNMKTETSRANMVVHQEVTTCHHTASTLTIMAHSKTNKETTIEAVTIERT